MMEQYNTGVHTGRNSLVDWTHSDLVELAWSLVQ